MITEFICKGLHIKREITAGGAPIWAVWEGEKIIRVLNPSEQILIEAALAAAAPSPAVAMEPAQLAVTIHAKAHSTTVVIKLIKDNVATCIYSADHSANGESIGVSDLPDGLFQITAQAPEPCGGCGEKDPAKRCIGCHHTFAALSPSLAVRDVVDAARYRLIKSKIGMYAGWWQVQIPATSLAPMEDLEAYFESDIDAAMRE